MVATIAFEEGPMYPVVNASRPEYPKARMVHEMQRPWLA